MKMILSVVFNISFLVRWREILKNLWKLEIKPLFGKKTFPVQRSKFAWAVGKCRGISPFYSICLGNKNAEAVKFWEIKKKSFPRTKKEISCKRKKYFFHKETLFYKTQIIHVHLCSLFIPSFRIFIPSLL